MRKYVLAAVLVLMASGAQATLIDRGDGFIYDDVQDITWTQNANINGQATWDAQVAWAAGYSQTHTVYGTFNDWRLPTTLQPDASCSTQVPPGQGSGYGCTGSEMGHLFNVDEITPTASGLFTNLQSYYYWSGTEYAPHPVWVWVFGLGGEDAFVQGAAPKDEFTWHALAVRDGDIAPIPEPTTALLLTLALAGLGLRRRH